MCKTGKISSTKPSALFLTAVSPNTRLQTKFSQITAGSEITFENPMHHYFNSASYMLDDNDELRPLKLIGGGVSGEVYLVSNLGDLD